MDNNVYECACCTKIRPNPQNYTDIETMKEWREVGEGWWVLSTWDRHKKFYLCPDCARTLVTEIRY